MRVKPIIFSGSMVRALLDGRKTQTRRVLKPQPDFPPNPRGGIGFSCMTPARHYEMRGWTEEDGPLMRHRPLPYWRGDLLYVRESVTRFDKGTCDQHVWYRAGGNEFYTEITGSPDGEWPNGVEGPGCGAAYSVPSIHMPRWASRLTLEVTGVKVDRLRDISEADAEAEGVRERFAGVGLTMWEWTPDQSVDCCTSPTGAFAKLWDSINGKDPAKAWDANPWVVAVTFKVHRCNVDEFVSAHAADPRFARAAPRGRPDGPGGLAAMQPTGGQQVRHHDKPL